MADHYDAIIIGTGAGGGTLAHTLAKAGKRILVLERGPFLPREQQNWDTTSVFLDNRYHTKDVWTDKDGNDIHPGTGYWVGGNTKVYGAAAFRLREKDFEDLHHEGGLSPAWLVKYDEFEPYYGRAEHLYDVHGSAGSTRPTRGGASRTPTRRCRTSRGCRPSATRSPTWGCGPTRSRWASSGSAVTR